MRGLYQATAVAAVMVFVLAVKAVIPTPRADAAVTAKIDALQMQAASPALPMLPIRDMTFALE
jgi:hypothetical protein